MHIFLCICTLVRILIQSRKTDIKSYTYVHTSHPYHCPELFVDFIYVGELWLESISLWLVPNLCLKLYAFVCISTWFDHNKLHACVEMRACIKIQAWTVKNSGINLIDMNLCWVLDILGCLCMYICILLYLGVAAMYVLQYMYVCLLWCLCISSYNRCCFLF